MIAVPSSQKWCKDSNKRARKIKFTLFFFGERSLSSRVSAKIVTKQAEKTKFTSVFYKASAVYLRA